MKKGLKPPKGYQNELKYKNEFVKSAGSIDQVNTILIEELQSPDVIRIGIIVDANNIGVQTRFESLKHTIQSTLDITLPEEAIVSINGFTHQVLDNLFIGIWIMPDNSNSGYLEHFISNLISEEDQVWQFAKAKVNELMAESFCEFTETKKRKALLHTYLAWKKTPGLPMGTAVNANYFDLTSHYADGFIKWFQTTFELEQ